MSRCWLAIVEGEPDDASAVAHLHSLGGAPRGLLACWHRRAKPVRGAMRCDERVIDRAGEGAWLSIVLAPAGVRLPFDDIAVQQARREVLARNLLDGVSTLLRDDSHFEGAISVARGPGACRLLADDPFARVFPAELLQVDAGILGHAAPPAGPVIERYGSANPWPWDRFDDQRRGTV